MHFPSSGNLHSTLHYIALNQTKRLKKKIKYILIHNNTLQSFVWLSIALNILVSHFEDWIFLFVVSLQWLEITHVFHFSKITSYRKKFFKISLLPLTKKVSLKKALINLHSVWIYIWYHNLLYIFISYQYIFIPYILLVSIYSFHPLKLTTQY